jgi:hypothetical protein
VCESEKNERVKKTRFERLWLRTEYLDAYKAFEAWRQKVEDAERVESQAWEMLHAPIQTARNQRGAIAHTINPQHISPNINDGLRGTTSATSITPLSLLMTATTPAPKKKPSGPPISKKASKTPST